MTAKKPGKTRSELLGDGLSDWIGPPAPEDRPIRALPVDPLAPLGFDLVLPDVDLRGKP